LGGVNEAHHFVIHCRTLFVAGVAWAGAEAYKLVMSKDKKLCANMLNLFNADMKEYRQICYDKHEMFTRLGWQPVDVGKEPYACGMYQYALFDINNDGKDELVIKTSHCLRDQLTDSLYIFPPNSKVLQDLKEPSSHPFDTVPDKLEFVGKGGFEYDLKELPESEKEKLLEDIRKTLPKSMKGLDLKPGIGGVLVIQPFQIGKTIYISMTDLHQEWIVVGKYKQADTLEDLCYFHGKSLIR
jgi:hypothetical protein